MRRSVGTRPLAAGRANQRRARYTRSLWHRMAVAVGGVELDLRLMGLLTLLPLALADFFALHIVCGNSLVVKLRVLVRLPGKQLFRRNRAERILLFLLAAVFLGLLASSFLLCLFLRCLFFALPGDLLSTNKLYRSGLPLAIFKTYAEIRENTVADVVAQAEKRHIFLFASVLADSVAEGAKRLQKRRHDRFHVCVCLLRSKPECVGPFDETKRRKNARDIAANTAQQPSVGCLLSIPEVCVGRSNKLLQTQKRRVGVKVVAQRAVDSILSLAELSVEIEFQRCPLNASVVVPEARDASLDIEKEFRKGLL
eukprot:Opistho-2@18565